MIGWATWAVALAQDPIATGSVQQLHASVDSQRTVWVDDAAVSREGAVQVRALGSFASRPLVVEQDGQPLAVVRYAWQTDLGAAVTAGRARIGLSVPVVLGVGSDLPEVASVGLSDVGLDAKYTIRDPEVVGLGIAAKARVGVPVGPAGVTGLASRGPWLEALLVADGAVAGVHLVGNLGVRVGTDAVIAEQRVGDQLLGRFALAVPLLDDRVGAALEIASRVGVRAPLAGSTPVEAALTGWLRLGDRLALRGGFGRWVVDGYGASPARAMIGVSTHPRSRVQGPRPSVAEDAPDGPPDGGRDRDGDGVVDARDRCPREPEDPDGFEDQDGCPEGVRLGVRILAEDGAVAHGAFAWLRCGGAERVRLMPDEVIDVPEGSCVLDASGIGWSAKQVRRMVHNGPPVEWTVELVPNQPMTRLLIDVTAADGQPLDEVLWSVGSVYGRVTDGRVAMALPVGRYPVRVKARGTTIDERQIEVDEDGLRLQVTLERE